MTDDRVYAVGTTSGNLRRLDWAEIPPPDQCVFYPYQKDELRGDLTYQSIGHMQINWVWDIMSTHTLSRLVRMLFDSETDVSSTRYITSPRRNGWFPNDQAATKTYEVTCKRPFLTSQEGQPITRSPMAYSSVTFTFMVLAEV